MKRLLLSLVMAFFLALTHLPEASATTYVRLKITFSDKAGNLPAGLTLAEARGANDSFFTSATMKNGSFNLDVPQGMNLNLRVFLIFSQPEKFGSNELASQSKRTIVPNIDFSTRNPLQFNVDSEIDIRFDAPKILSLNVTDSQLRLVQNAEINSEWLLNKIEIQGSEWNLIQRQLIPGGGSQISSKDGTFQFAFYTIGDGLIKFGYFDKSSGLSGVTREFRISEFELVNLCLPFNFDSTRTTNKDCLENVLKEKAAVELKAKQEAEAKAAELRAKQEVEAKAAELRAKQEVEAKAAELRAKQEVEAKAAELKAKQDADAKAAAVKKTSITCIKGKLTKKVIAVKPKCPSGYKKK
jgi:hypothetical protein